MSRHLDRLPADARDLAEASTTWMDQWWDPASGLLWNPEGSFEEAFSGPRQGHIVRETAWYALGLLLRDGPGDVERARTAIGAVLDAQYDEPGTIWHGTFRRFPEEPHPPAEARMWVDYDPNWRQFVGTTLALVRRQFGDALDAGAHERIAAALDLAIAGEPPDRVTPNYANIALMRAWLEVEVGHATDDRGLVARGEDYAAEVVATYDRYGSFEEYNSPTYYGIDLYALALWRSHSPSEKLREWGERVEASLWRDVAAFYHAGLKNLAGPYTRAYGLDLRAYAGNIGQWIWAAVGRERAPFPDVERPFVHSHDFTKGPLIAFLGARVPDDALPHLISFQKERVVERTIAEGRLATAWLGERAMTGAESSGLAWGGWPQYHAGTLHWETPDGDVGWARLRHPGAIEARARSGGIEVTCRASDRGPAPATWALHGPGLDASSLSAERWNLPGLTVTVSTDASEVEVTTGRDGLLEVRYHPLDPTAAVRTDLTVHQG